MAIIGITAVQYPESRMSVAFLDQMVPHSFSIGSVSNLQTRKHYIIQLKCTSMATIVMVGCCFDTIDDTSQDSKLEKHVTKNRYTL